MSTATRPRWRTRLLTAWQALQPRERRLLQAAALLVGGALLWSQMLAPSLRTLRDAPAQRQQLDAQLERMQQLRAQVLSHSHLPTQADNPQAWRQALAASTAPLGGELRWQGDGAVLQLPLVHPEVLGQWLASNASQGPVRVTQASLQRNPQGQWQGELTLEPR